MGLGRARCLEPAPWPSFVTRASSGAAALGLALAGCAPPAIAEAPSCDEVGVVIEPASPPDRRVLGAAAPYPADTSLAGRQEELARSQRARREVAWAAVARVLAPSTLAEVTPIASATVPAFRTWYDRDDINRMFQHAFAGLGPERRAAHDSFDDAELDDTFAWNPRAVDEIEGWSPARFAEHVAGLHGQHELDGLGGIRRIHLSPDAARHVIASYSEVLGCMGEGAPPAFVDGPSAIQRLERAELALPRCHEQTFGPYFVASGSRLHARLEATHGALDATIAIQPSLDGIAGEAACRADGAVGCEVTGPGGFFVTAAAGSELLQAHLEVELASPADIAPACVRGSFPPGAATIAAHWVRADLGLPMPTYDTSAEALRRRLDSGALTWGDGDGTADPGDDRIYTMSVPAGPLYRLAGFHIRTRELAHWLNITLWWSPQPDTDFGEDRPDSIRALGGPWSQYKMCVSMEFDELDPDPSGGFAADAPGLGAALTAVHDRASWCSNPYIDAAPGLLRSNCVGCHQHALSGLRPGEVALDEVRFPDGGRAAARNNAPADGFWGFDAGDDFGAVLRDTVSWWEAAE